MTHDFRETQFLISCLEEKNFPTLYIQRETLCPEIAVVGRSNAGKSSLLNHLTQKKHLVFVSATPGKTQTLNFFTVGKNLVLVDLPGYGFAKIRKDVKESWGQGLSDYLEKRTQLRLLIIVLDLRRDPSPEDEQMIAWAHFHKKKLLFAFTKSDKLTSSQKKIAEEKLLQSLTLLLPDKDFLHITYSIKEGPCRASLRELIFSSVDVLPGELHGSS